VHRRRIVEGKLRVPPRAVNHETAKVRVYRTARTSVAQGSADLFVVIARRESAGEVVAQLMGHTNADTTLNPRSRETVSHHIL